MSNLSQIISLLSNHLIDYYMIPSTDEYNSEYPPVDTRRLEFVTGFSGSNGVGFIGKINGIFITDGRYITQAQKQLDNDYFTIINYQDDNFQNIVAKYLGNNKMIGYDPKIITSNYLKIFNTLNFKPIQVNLVDTIWTSKPSRFIHKPYIYDVKSIYDSMDIKNLFESSLNHQNTRNNKQDKYYDILDRVMYFIDYVRNHCEYYIITDSSIICWMLNLRGYEIDFSPMILSCCIVSTNKISVYLSSNISELNIMFNAINKTLKHQLGNINNISNAINIDTIIEFYDYAQFEKDIAQITGKVCIDKRTCPSSVIDTLTPRSNQDNTPINSKPISLITENNPLDLMKSIKSEEEIKYIKHINIIESIVLCETLSWLENSVNIKEQDVVDKLISERKKYAEYLMDSFPTICGYNENSAIIHYRPCNQNSSIINDGVVLVDTGAHYIGGTTDTTRTILLNAKFHQDIKNIQSQYTKVLMGHIDIATLKFPHNISGSNIDVLARRYLWQDQQDYPHGTGHGVGNCLSVHEGPISINRINNVKLQKGMILSNEPGFYIKDKYGIRIENLVLVCSANSTSSNIQDNSNFLEFQNLIFVPYCLKLIEMNMLNKKHLEYLHEYQKQIQNYVYPYATKKTQKWIRDNTIQ